MKPRAPSKELADVRGKVELSATIVLVSDLSVVVPSEEITTNSSVSTPSRTLKDYERTVLARALPRRKVCTYAWGIRILSSAGDASASHSQGDARLAPSPCSVFSEGSREGSREEPNRFGCWCPVFYADNAPSHREFARPDDPEAVSYGRCSLFHGPTHTHTLGCTCRRQAEYVGAFASTFTSAEALRQKYSTHHRLSTAHILSCAGKVTRPPLSHERMFTAQMTYTYFVVALHNVDSRLIKRCGQKFVSQKSQVRIDYFCPKTSRADERFNGVG